LTTASKALLPWLSFFCLVTESLRLHLSASIPQNPTWVCQSLAFTSWVYGRFLLQVFLVPVAEIEVTPLEI